MRNPRRLAVYIPLKWFHDYPPHRIKTENGNRRSGDKIFFISALVMFHLTSMVYNMIFGNMRVVGCGPHSKYIFIFVDLYRLNWGKQVLGGHQAHCFLSVHIKFPHLPDWRWGFWTAERHGSFVKPSLTWNLWAGLQWGSCMSQTSTTEISYLDFAYSKWCMEHTYAWSGISH